MKNLSTIIIFIGVIQFLSGCSQGYRSNTQSMQQAQLQHQQIKQASAPKKINRASQQAHSNALVSQHSVRSRISRLAHSTIGSPYKWGGNNPHQGFDCSGLMSYIHKNAIGVNIPRTAAEQRDKSRTISYAELQPGDMLFFKTGKRSNHVGIYVGNRKFVHAATGSKHVKVASMDSSYWHKRFVKFGTFL